MQLQQILTTQKIISIQIHLYPSYLTSFHNTFYVEILRRLNKGIAITIINHDHPLHNSSELPFAIVNGTYLIPKQRLLNLLEAVSLQQPIKLVYMRSIIKICEQLAAVGRVFTKQSPNPYYLLLSPLKKWQMYRFNNQVIKQICRQTHYITQDHEKQRMNEDYILYQLNTLSNFASELKKIYGNKLSQERMIGQNQENISKSQLEIVLITAIYALIKFFRLNNDYLFNLSVKFEVLRDLEEEGLKMIENEHERRQPQNIYISVLKEPIKEQNKDNREGKVNVYEKLAIPIIGFAIFWKINGIFKS